MSGALSPIDKAKFAAAKRATAYVQSGMRVGLGTGSTAAWLVRCLGEMVRDNGLRIRGVPTSARTAQLAREVGIEVMSLDEARWLDVTIDGADEYDSHLNLIKGGGGALLQEKIVATASDQMIVIADISKQVETPWRIPPAHRSDPVWLADHQDAGRGNPDRDGCAGPLHQPADERRAALYH